MTGKERVNHLVFIGDSIETEGQETWQGYFLLLDVFPMKTLLPRRVSCDQSWALLGVEKRLIRNGVKS